MGAPSEHESVSMRFGTTNEELSVLSESMASAVSSFVHWGESRRLRSESNASKGDGSMSVRHARCRPPEPPCVDLAHGHVAKLSE